MSEICYIFAIYIIKGENTMARPIKETPELSGKDAVRFETLISNPKPVSNEEKERARKAYEVMKSISNFQW